MKINFFSWLLWIPIYLFIYLHIYLLLVLSFAIYNALYTSISFLKAKGFSVSGLFQNLNFCHVKCLCQLLFMLTRYINTSWPLLPMTFGFAMNERQRLLTYQLPCVQDISIWTNQITGNYISSSGCGPDWGQGKVLPRMVKNWILLSIPKLHFGKLSE